jgi:hypothetical protein
MAGRDDQSPMHAKRDDQSYSLFLKKSLTLRLE